MKKLLVAAGMILLLTGCASDKEVTPVSEIPADHKVELQEPKEDTWADDANDAAFQMMMTTIILG
ncbi:TPA: hypothetical protein ACGXMV_004152 [Bacillus pacificus]